MMTFQSSEIDLVPSRNTSWRPLPSSGIPPKLWPILLYPQDRE